MKSIILNSFVLSGFMVEGLQLKGNELICYAILYNFAQDGDFHFVKTSYLKKWINITQQGVSWILNSLNKKGFIEIKKNGRENQYKICQGPIDACAERYEQEWQQKRDKKKGQSGWDKAMWKAQIKLQRKSEISPDLSSLGEELRQFDPYGFQETKKKEEKRI